MPGVKPKQCYKGVASNPVALLTAQLVSATFDIVLYVRGSPSREASVRALLARSLIRHYLRTLHKDRDGDRNNWRAGA
jgi:hypothetical protein